MTAARERDVVGSFVRIAGALVSGGDPIALLGDLVEDCTRLLDVTDAGLLLADRHGALHVLAASSEDMARLEAFQAQQAEGPCQDCYRDAAPVSISDLRRESRRWPTFVPAALSAGFLSVHAVPLRLRNDVLGALGLFGDATGELNQPDLQLAQGLADVASIALVQDRASADHQAVSEQLQAALASRVVIEQAKGVISQRASLDMGGAFALLRQYARDHNQRLQQVAQAVVQRQLPVDELLGHARSERR